MENKELKEISLGLRKWWKIDRKDLADMEREFIKEVGGLIYELGYRLEQEMGEDYDMYDWINSQDNAHNLSTELWKIEQLVEKYNKVFHILDTVVAHTDSGLGKEEDIKILKEEE
jgi:hypothetical protein